MIAIPSGISLQLPVQVISASQTYVILFNLCKPGQVLN